MLRVWLCQKLSVILSRLHLECCVGDLRTKMWAKFGQWKCAVPSHQAICDHFRFLRPIRTRDSGHVPTNVKTQTNTRETPYEINKLYWGSVLWLGQLCAFVLGQCFWFFWKIYDRGKSTEKGRSREQFYEKLCKEKYTVFGQNKGFSLVTIYLKSRVFPRVRGLETNIVRGHRQKIRPREGSIFEREQSEEPEN